MDCGGKIRKKDNRYKIVDLEGKEFVLSVTYLKPTKSTRGHSHNYEEGYYFAQGLGKMEIGKEIKQVSEGQFMMIPPNTFHCVYNEGLLSLTFVCAWMKRNE